MLQQYYLFDIKQISNRKCQDYLNKLGLKQMRVSASKLKRIVYYHRVTVKSSVIEITSWPLCYTCTAKKIQRPLLHRQ